MARRCGLRPSWRRRKPARISAASSAWPTSMRMDAAGRSRPTSAYPRLRSSPRLTRRRSPLRRSPNGGPDAAAEGRSGCLACRSPPAASGAILGSGDAGGSDERTVSTVPSARFSRCTCARSCASCVCSRVQRCAGSRSGFGSVGTLLGPVLPLPGPAPSTGRSSFATLPPLAAAAAVGAPTEADATCIGWERSLAAGRQPAVSVVTAAAGTLSPAHLSHKGRPGLFRGLGGWRGGGSSSSVSTGRFRPRTVRGRCGTGEFARRSTAVR